MELRIDEAASQRSILSAIASLMNDACQRAKPLIRTHINALVDTAIQSRPEAESLVRGRLRGELGVVDGQAAVRAIVLTVQKSILLEVRPFTANLSGINGGFRFGILKNDISDLLALDCAAFTSEGGFDIPWLEWLLTKGTEPLVEDYFFAPARLNSSRTGQGIMLGLDGQSWHVPDKYAGTESDNWLTRAVFGAANEVGTIIVREIERNAR